MSSIFRSWISCNFKTWCNCNMTNTDNCNINDNDTCNNNYNDIDTRRSSWLEITPRLFSGLLPSSGKPLAETLDGRPPQPEFQTEDRFCLLWFYYKFFMKQIKKQSHMRDPPGEAPERGIKVIPCTPGNKVWPLPCPLPSPPR